MHPVSHMRKKIALPNHGLKAVAIHAEAYHKVTHKTAVIQTMATLAVAIHAGTLQVDGVPPSSISGWKRQGHKGSRKCMLYRPCQRKPRQVF